MAWQQVSAIRGGDWVLVDLHAGLQIDVGVLDSYDVLERFREYTAAAGLPVTWERVDWDRGIIFGAGGSLRVLGRATGQVESATVARVTGEALESFWTVVAASGVAYASPGGAVPPPFSGSQNQWATALTWVSAAVVIGGIAYILYQIRKAFA